MRLLVNVLQFQIAWFCCLLLPTPWVLVVCIAVLVIHFRFIVDRADYRQETHALLLALIVGVIIESVYLQFAILSRVDGSLWPPLWLLCLWVLFASTLRHSLAWLQHRYYLTAVFAAIAAPASYYAGATLNELMMVEPPLLISLGIIALSWALALPLLMYLIFRLSNPLSNKNV